MGDLWAALALVLVLEGMLPFLAPQQWKAMIAQIAELPDRQLRIAGLLCMLGGLAMLAWVRGG